MGISETTGSESAVPTPRSRREAKAQARTQDAAPAPVQEAVQEAVTRRSRRNAPSSTRVSRAATPRSSRSAAPTPAAAAAPAGVEEISSRRRVGRTAPAAAPTLEIDLDDDAPVSAELDLPGAPQAQTSGGAAESETGTAAEAAPRSRRDARRAEQSTARPAGRRERTGRTATAGRAAGGRASGGRASGGRASNPTRAGVRRLGDRRVWGTALATAMVLLIPGTTLLSPKAKIIDSALNSNNGDVYGALPTGDATTQTAIIASRTAKSTEHHHRRTTTTTTTTTSNAPKPATSSPAGPSSTAPSSGANDTVGKASGLPWSSGAFVAADSVAKANDFGNWRGLGLDVVSSFSARNNWNDVINPSWLLQAWSSTSAIRSFGIPPIPEDGSGNLQSCASGAYNDKWRTFGQNVKNTGFSDKIVIRLGWEFNGNWYKWQANDPAAFAGCWRQIVSTVEAIAPATRWDWNVNRGSNSGQPDPKQAWPGDDYVDFVGVDSYDMWPGVKSEADWQQHYAGDQGLKYWADFARAHGKKLSVPEWGVYPGTASQGSNGGDNPFYIQKMIGFFKQQGDLMGYESYFNEPAGYIASSLYGPTQNGAAAEAYKQALAAVN